MSRFWIVNLIDKIFVSAAVFLLCFAWINFYVSNLWTTFVLSLIFSFAIVFLLYFFLGKKQEKDNLSKKEINEMNRCFLAFRLMKKAEQMNLIKALLIKENITPQAAKKLTYKDEKGEHLVVIATDIATISNNDLINILNANYCAKYDCYDIFCNEVAITNENMLKNKKIIFINHKKLYERLKAADLCPNTENISTDAIKITFKDFAKAMFLPNKARSYFLCGLVLIFSSIILPRHFYYIIFGSTLMLFAIICKILPKIAPKS